jgi:hypothetical protein
MPELAHWLFALCVGVGAGCSYYVLHTAVWHVLRLLSLLVASLRGAE